MARTCSSLIDHAPCASLSSPRCCRFFETSPLQRARGAVSTSRNTSQGGSAASGFSAYSRHHGPLTRSWTASASWQPFDVTAADSFVGRGGSQQQNRCLWLLPSLVQSP